MKDFSIDFFRDEVRSGFFIPTAIKQAWAAQLMILDIIDKICQKHHITYFADWGTLLGTVRHGGYVPWDDDLDICMKRDDYTRFKEAAKTELPDNFCIHDYAHKDNHWLFLSRVVNHAHICYEPAHLKQFHNFPYLASIDIFVLDYLYADPKEEETRCKEIKHILSIADAIIDGKLNKNVEANALSSLEQKYHIQFDRGFDSNRTGIELYRLAEEQMARVPENASEKLGQIFPWILLGGDGLDKKYYDTIVRLPFENTTMPVPANYHKVLSSRYGEYFQPKKVWDGHEYPFFEGQRANLQAVADFKLPEFTFNTKMLRKNCPSNTTEQNIKNIVQGCILELDTLYQNYCKYMDAEQIKDARDILPKCQGLAIDLGNYIEMIKGENSIVAKTIIPTLEIYCENLFQLHSYLTEPEATQVQQYKKNTIVLNEELKKSFIQVKKAADTMILKRKTVALLPDSPLRWIEMECLYYFYQNQPDTDVYVIPLPVFAKDPYGQVSATEEELHLNARENEYPDDIPILPWDKTDIQAYGFDVIVIQNPYDGENPYLTVPEMYYAKTLQKYTKCLVYLMPAGVKEFGEADKTDFYGLKNYLTMPGAMYADKILIHSAKMKSVYIEFLMNFAGNDTKEIWEDKLSVISDFIGDNPMPDMQVPKSEPTILYCIGEDEFADNAEVALENIKQRIATFKKYEHQIKIVACTYPCQMSKWSVCSEEIKLLIQDILYANQDGERFKICLSDPIDIQAIDAYYGSPTPFVHVFSELQKPVMISQRID